MHHHPITASHRIASHRIAYMATSVELKPSTDNTEIAAVKKYRTYIVKSWHEYQRFIGSHLHSIEHYIETCKEDAKLYGDDVMVLRDNVTKITGYYWYSSGFPAQNCADTDGYVDVRTGKQYPHNGGSYFEDINCIRYY
jgi:hypothetical protein